VFHDIFPSLLTPAFRFLLLFEKESLCIVPQNSKVWWIHFLFDVHSN
jgi:hypothetical protein